MGLTASIISIESSFRSDPAVADPSRGEDLSSQLDRTEKEFFQKYGAWLSIPPVPQLYQRYKDKYYPRSTSVSDRGRVEVVAREIADEMKRDVSILPEFMRTFVHKEN